MFSKNNLFSYLFLFCLFPGMFLSCGIVKSADELLCLGMFVLLGMDVFENGWGALRRYKLLMMVVAIFMFYYVYSIVVRHSNSLGAITSDFVSEIKPYFMFATVYGLKVKMLPRQKQMVKIASIVNVVLCVICIILWAQVKSVLGYLGSIGAIILLSGLSYVYCSVDERGRLSRYDFWCSIVMVSIGLLCGRSKYFGEYVIFLAMMAFYKPGLFSNFKLKNVLYFTLVICIILFLAWNKIYFYFIEGSKDLVTATTDDVSEMSDNFARPILYAVAFLVFIDYFPFGSGLASYASYASAEPYSDLYYDYGVNYVYGLSPQFSDFICDAYYPTLAQFGVVGLLLFFALWFYVFRYMRHLEKRGDEIVRYPCILIVMGIVFVLIESIGSTFIIQVSGMHMMMMLAAICSGRYEQQNLTAETDNEQR